MRKLNSLLSLVFGIGVVVNLHAQILPAAFGVATPSRPVGSNLGSSGPIITSGLVLLLDAGNTSSYSGSGTTWTDLSGNNNHGTLINGPTYSSINGGSIVFDGTDDVASFGNILNMGLSSWTLSCWVKFNSGSVPSSGPAGIIGKTSYRGYVGRYSFYIEDNNLHAFFQPDVNYSVTTPIAPYLDNKFHNLVMTIDRTSMMYFYIDGVSVGTPLSVSGVSSIDLNSSTDNFYIGSYGSNNGQSPQYFFNGNVGQASIYNRALTSAEVLQNYNAFRPRFLSIGDSYGGGKLAYVLKAGDPGYDATTPHGLIAATSDYSTRIRWHNGSYITTGATATALGTGFANTNAIIAIQGTGSYAASVARNHTEGGYTDWYLPSKDELEKLRINKNAIGGFGGDWYYSSSENTGTSPATAWLIGNSSGTWWPNVKHEAWSVRPVRAF